MSSPIIPVTLDKALFAAYLNMAKHNVFITLEFITQLAGGKEIKDEDAIFEVQPSGVPRFQNSLIGQCLLDPEQDMRRTERVIALLDKHFPFSYAMLHGQLKHQQTASAKVILPGPSDYYALFCDLILALNQGRNFCTHYLHHPVQWPVSLLYHLENGFDEAVNKVKVRFGLEENQVLHLRLFTANKNKQLKDDKGRTIRSIPNPLLRYPFRERADRNAPTHYAWTFFTCLFLERKYSEMLLKKISGFKDSARPEFKASLDAFCVNSIRLPFPKMESHKPKEAFFLDMVNELARCPDNLYEHLHETDQQKFITQTLVDEAEHSITHRMTLEDEAEDSALETVMKRTDDRFAYFALNYLDRTEAFRDIRFQVDLGHYHFSIYPKEINGNREFRHLTEHLFGYGRIQDFDPANRPPEWKELCKELSAYEKQEVPYIRETYPHYHIEQQLINLKNTSGEPARWPSVATEPVPDSPRHRLVNGKKAENNKADMVLSAYELPGLVFYHYLSRKPTIIGSPAEFILVSYYSRFKKFLNAIKSGAVNPVLDSRPLEARKAELVGIVESYKLKLAQLPEKLVNSLLGIAPADREIKARHRLEEQLRQANRIHAQLLQRESQTAKPGKKQHKKLKAGVLASRLAEDMVSMQPPLMEDGKTTGRGKANATEFQLLQSTLAFFGRDKEQLKGIFRACRLIDSDNKHPFLDCHELALEKHKGIPSFYKAYYEQKIHYLEQCLKDSNYARYYYFLNLSSVSPDECKAVAEAYDKADAPLLLPRGLYRDALVEWFAKNGSEAMKAAIRSSRDGEVNVVYLIKKYMELEWKDGNQEFYQWPMTYRFFDPLGYKPKPGQNRDRIFYTLEQRRNQENKWKEEVRQLKELKLPHLEEEAGKKLDILEEMRKRYRNRRGEWDVLRNELRLELTWYFKPEQVDKGFQKGKYKKGWVQEMFAVCDYLETVTLESVNEVKKKLNAYRYFCKNEKRLRHTQAEDMILFLMIKDMLERNEAGIKLPSGAETGEAAVFALKHIRPANHPEPVKAESTSRNILELSPVGGIQLEVTYSDEDAPNGSIKGVKTIGDNFVKIKNYGKFRRFAKDRRLNNLFLYLDEPVLNRDWLEKELEMYDKVRLEVVRHIFLFEEALSERYQITIPAGDSFLEHRELLDIYFRNFPEDSGIKEQLLDCRNRFLHNKYPTARLFPVVKMMFKQGEISSISAWFLNFAESTYGKFVQVLNQTPMS